jgi:hypothetical protein
MARTSLRRPVFRALTSGATNPMSSTIHAIDETHDAI